MQKIRVVADFDWLDKEEEVGILGYDSLRGTSVYTFEFDKAWLKKYSGIMLGGDLQPFTGIQYNKERNQIFGTFSDSLPDRWGRRLIDLRVNTSLKEHGQSVKKLSDWDYIMGVEDKLRMGAFRFKELSSDNYICYQPDSSVPPVMYLDDLMQAAGEIEKSEYRHLEPEERWIQRLFQPGSSMGGARPKACVQDNGTLYVAKFPSFKDDVNVARWEHFAHLMALECGINAAETKVVSSKDGRDIFLSKRFDRTEDGRRIHMASSLSLLGLNDGDGERSGKGYLDIVDFIISNGGGNVDNDLEELYRRVAFNICIGNTDDHFRNHAFLLGKDGWKLSPAYDMNPTLKYSQALMIDDCSNDSNLDILYESHEAYMLDERTARTIITDVTRNFKYWESTARKLQLPKSEMDVFRGRFEDGMQWKYSSGIHR